MFTPPVDYSALINDKAAEVLAIMAERASAEDLARIKQAYEFASKAHADQRRKSGEPYIIHPVSVAHIVASELRMGANCVIAAFLHDVVEDTPYTIDDIRDMFGDDVAFLVDVVTKRKEQNTPHSQQVANYRQLLDSMQYDIRALMIKLADRLHNMRTLASMRSDKQMKIAGETDYFYAPLANRLGLFYVKTDLENLSFKYRCPMQYEDLSRALILDQENNNDRLMVFSTNIELYLRNKGIDAKARIYYRKPFSIWRRMQTDQCDFNHVEHRYYVRVTFTPSPTDHRSEKDICLKIYSLLTDVYKEKPQSFINLIDQAKENSYQCLRMKLLSEEGIWEDVQICSDQMVESSKLGILSQVAQEGMIADWIERFRQVLRDIAKEGAGDKFLERIATTLYYDDVMVFTPNGRAIIMPKDSTAIDLAFELHTDIGMHAKYARINGQLASIKTVLQRGDCVEIGTDPDAHPRLDWMDNCCTYKAKRTLRKYHYGRHENGTRRCPICHPLPGGEIIGYKGEDGIVIIHRRTCPEAIKLASQYGDRITDVDFKVEEDKTYLVKVVIKAIDRYHLLIDLVDGITNTLHLLIDSLRTDTKDDIVDCVITFFVHSTQELVEAINHLNKIDGVDEVRQVDIGRRDE